MTHTEFATILKNDVLPAYKRVLKYAETCDLDVEYYKRYLFLRKLGKGICRYVLFKYHVSSRDFFDLKPPQIYLAPQPIVCCFYSEIIHAHKVRISWMENFIAAHYVAPANNS